MKSDYTKLTNKKKMHQIEVGGLRIEFQRTCRVAPGKVNSLPAGLGPFPIYKTEDFKSGIPKDWKKKGYFMPMYKQEALWLNFKTGFRSNPKALVVAAGNINAISGKPFKPRKSDLEYRLTEEQNYLVVPPQPWLDGWKDKDGKVYQFVAAEMDSGQTVEGQITGEEKVGGIQLWVYAPKKGKILTPAHTPREHMIEGSWDPFYSSGLNDMYGGPVMKSLSSDVMCFASKGAAPVRTRSMKKNLVGSIRSMGLGKGGEISQKVYPDHYGHDVWKKQPEERGMIYLVSSEDFQQITGEEAPATPVTYQKYKDLGLPWFELGDEKLGDSEGSDVFGKLKPVSWNKQYSGVKPPKIKIGGGK